MRWVRFFGSPRPRNGGNLKSFLTYRLSPLFAILFLPVLAMAWPTDFDITSTSFGHEIGSKVAAGWSAYYTPNPHSRKFPTFGPYTTALRDGENLVATRYTLKPDQNKWLKATMEVYDQNQGGVISTRDMFSYGNVAGKTETVTAVLGFNVNTSHNVQFRTGHWGTGTVIQCKTIQYMQRDNYRYGFPPTYNNMYHQIGWQNGGYWEVDEADPRCASGCKTKFLTYGPYYNPGTQAAFPQFAVFHLAYSQTSGNQADTIAVIDVVESGQIIAIRDIRRAEFRTPYAMTPVALHYIVKPGKDYQYRVKYMLKGGLLRQGNTDIWVANGDACVD